MPESRLPELRIREKEVRARIRDLVLEHTHKKKGVKYKSLLCSYTSQLEAILNRINTLGKKHNLLEISVTYQEPINPTLSKHMGGIIYLTDVSIDDAKSIMKDCYPGLTVKSIKEIALKFVLPSRY